MHSHWGWTDLWAMTITPVLFYYCMLLILWHSLTSWLAGCPCEISTWAAVQEINLSSPKERNLSLPWELFGQQDQHTKWEESVGDVVFFDLDLWRPQDLIESPNNTMESNDGSDICLIHRKHNEQCHRVLDPTLRSITRAQQSLLFHAELLTFLNLFSLFKAFCWISITTCF